jgi:hypothetical protein
LVPYIQQDQPPLWEPVAPPGERPLDPGAQQRSERVQAADLVDERLQVIVQDHPATGGQPLAPLGMLVQGQGGEGHEPSDRDRGTDNVQQLDGCRVVVQQLAVQLAMVGDDFQG